MSIPRQIDLTLRDGDRLVVTIKRGHPVVSEIDLDILAAHIAESGPAGRHHVELNRRYGAHGADRLERALDVLLQDGRIVRRLKKGKTGRPRRVYFGVEVCDGGNAGIRRDSEARLER